MVPPGVAEVAAKAQRELAGRVLAITLRSVRDLDIAEEATADAFLLALQTWPERGVPASVEAWLVTAARRRAIDRIRSAQAARRALIRTAGGLRSGGDAADLSIEVGVIGDEDLRPVRPLTCRMTRPSTPGCRPSAGSSIWPSPSGTPRAPARSWSTTTWPTA